MKFLILFFLVCSTSAHAYPQCEMGGWLIAPALTE